jgi:hypothetical protein
MKNHGRGARGGQPVEAARPVNRREGRAVSGHFPGRRKQRNGVFRWRRCNAPATLPLVAASFNGGYDHGNPRFIDDRPGHLG